MGEEKVEKPKKYKKLNIVIQVFTKLMPGEWEDTTDPKLCALITESVFKGLGQWQETTVKRVNVTADVTLTENEYY